MKQKIEQILEDIYALEPVLRERDAEVRAMVRELLKARPTVTLDPAFVARLRERILDSAVPQAVPTPYRHDMLWWALRIAPIGALAALTIALIGTPQQTMIPMPQETVPRSFNIDPASAPVRSVAPASSDMPMAKTAPAGMGGGMSAESSVASDDAVMMMEYGAADTDEAMASDSIFIADQGPGDSIVIESLSLSVPAHVHIFAYEDGAPRSVVGTSGVIEAGAHAGVPVTLSRSTNAGETLYAQVFASDGDDVFTPYADAPLRDSAGNLIYAIFMINDI